MTERAFQDDYPDDLAWCYGCGRLNEHGLKIRSFWDGDETVATIHPRPHHTSVPGFVYGGFIASVIDCHSTGSAAAAAHRAAGGDPAIGPYPRFLTGTLKVEYLKPTPIDAPVELRSTIVEVKERKVVLTTTLTSKGTLCARGEAILVKVPETWEPRA